MSAAQPIHPDHLLAHADALRRLARALLQDDGLADDVAQQALLTALEQRPRSPAALGAWLRRVARHEAIAIKVSSERRDRRERAAARTDSVPSHVETIEALELQRDVVEAVSALPEPYRTVIYQRYYQDLPPRAIAAQQGTPLKTVKTRLWRGLELLRTRFDVEHGDRRIWAATLLPVAHGQLAAPGTAAALTAPAAGVLTMTVKTVVGIGAGLVLLAGALLVVAGGWLTQRESRPAADPVERVEQSSAQRRETASTPEEPARSAVDAAPTPERGGSIPTVGQLLVQCVWSDERPAASVHVSVFPTDRLLLHLGKQHFVTDADGRVLATELPPGRFTVRTDRGKTMRAEVRAGELATVHLKIGRGVDVRGVVVDAHGQSVAGARIYLAGTDLDWSAGFAVSRSGPDGRFRLRSIRPEDSLWATAARHGPSDVLDLERRDVTSGSVDVTLRLSKSGATVHGRVVDPDGRAVEGARIALGAAPPRHLETRVDGSQIEVRVPRVATSDEGGFFAFEGVAPGRQVVVAHAEGWPTWQGDTTVEPRARSTVLIQLERGALVRGVVRDESGELVRGAVVLALPAPVRNPGQGPPDMGRPFPHPGARTDERGAFELPPVAAGQIHLYASKGEGRWTIAPEKRSTFRGFAQETLTVLAGQEVVWEPRLSIGLEIEGRVTYADGAPMQRVFVHVRPEGGRGTKTTTTDEAGRFIIPALARGPHRVSVVLRGAPSGTEPLVRTGVHPDRGLLELRAGYSEHETGTGRVGIRFVDSGRRVTGEASVVFATTQNWFRANSSSGTYTATLRPGRYRPVAMAGDVEVGEGPWFDLRAGDDVDLGTLYSGPGGDLLIRVNRAAAPDGDLEILVRTVDGLPIRTKNAVVLRERADELRFENLSSGPAELSLWGENCLTERLRVDIVAGAITEANFDLRRGTRRDLEFHAANAQGAFDLTLRDASGAVLYETRRDDSSKPRKLFRYSIALPLGRVRITARTGSGLEFEGEVEFKSFEPAAAPMRFELR